VGNLTLANIFLLIFGLTGIKVFAKMVEMPKGLLLPLIIILSVVGAYAINNNIADIFWLLGFGVFGYFLKMAGFQVGPIILGVILGPLMDVSYRRAMISAGDHPAELLNDLMSSPISLTLCLVVTWLIISQTPLPRLIKARVGKASQA
jgi:putative tricarboxylic transport membrane protein